MKQIRQKNLQLALTWFESQRAMAEFLGIEPNYLNQLLTGHRGIGEDRARKFEKSLNKPDHWMDVEHGVEEGDGMYAMQQEEHYVTFDLLDVQAAAGIGKINADIPEVVKKINVLETWASKVLGGDLSRIRLISASGTSMQGTIENGDVLFVDSTISSYDGDGIYVIARESGDIQVKRLQKLHGNMLAIISDNKSFVSETLQAEAANSIVICGRVLASWTLNKLW